MKKIQGMFSCALPVAAATAVCLAALTPIHTFAQSPVNDKWITIVLLGEPPHLDGCFSGSSTQGRIIKQNVVETLIEKDAKDGSLKPRLATSWERIDPSTWRLKLREGVLFHDGAKFNAETAKKSLDRNWIKALSCKDPARFFGGMTFEVTPVDEYTIDIKTSRPEPIVPVRLAGISIVGPNSPTDKQALEPVGTGPYAFDSWQAGQQIQIKRFDKYWGAKPQIEGVRYLFRDVSSVSAAMVKIGEADIAHVIAEQDANDPKMDFSYLNSETTELRINAMVPPLNDRRVRLALNYAVNLDAMPGTVLPKDAMRATQNVVPVIPGHNHDLDKHRRPYDPAKARALLAEAKADGVPVDTEITLVSYPAQFANAGELNEAFLTMFKAAGFNMKVLTVEPGQYAKWSYKNPAESLLPTLVQTSHDNSSGDPVFSVSLRYGCDGASSSFCDPEFDKEVLRVSGLSGPERLEGWQNIYRVLYEDEVPVIPLYHMIGYTRVGPRIDFRPDVTSNAEIRIQEIKFK